MFIDRDINRYLKVRGLGLAASAVVLGSTLLAVPDRMASNALAATEPARTPIATITPTSTPEVIIQSPVEINREETTFRGGKLRTSIELSQGEMLVVSGSDIEIFGEVYRGPVVLGIRAERRLATNPIDPVGGISIAAPEGVSIRVTRLPAEGSDPARELERLNAAVAGRTAVLMIPGGSERAVTNVTMGANQLSPINPVTRSWVNVSIATR